MGHSLKATKTEAWYGFGQRAVAAENLFPATSQPAPVFDLTKDSNALQADKIVDSACQFCNSLCRLKVHLKAGRIIDITGETQDPVQAGGLCVKGPMMAQLVYNRLRLKHPLKRVAGEKGSGDSKFKAVPWDKDPVKTVCDVRGTLLLIKQECPPYGWRLGRGRAGGVRRHGLGMRKGRTVSSC